MKKIKFAIVGIGNIGRRHLAVIDAEERAEMVAICDCNAETAKEQSELYNNVPYYTDYDEMLRNASEADVVSICTPHHLHANMSISAANMKYNVLVEKPMATSSADCDAMIHAADENNISLMVVKQNRFNVPIEITRQIIEGGKLGKLFMVKCDVLWNRHQGYYDDSPWRGKLKYEGGALYTQVSHFIDLLIWWCGDVVDATGMIATLNHNVEVEDCGQASMKFSNGAVGALSWTSCVYNKNYEGSITIIGEKGTIKIGGKYLNKIEYWDVEANPLPENINFVDKPNLYSKYQGTSSNHEKVISNVVADMLDNKGEVVNGEVGKKTVVAIEKIYNGIIR